jgi:hypothetical protein
MYTCERRFSHLMNGVQRRGSTCISWSFGLVWTCRESNIGRQFRKNNYLIGWVITSQVFYHNRLIFFSKICNVIVEVDAVNIHKRNVAAVGVLHAECGKRWTHFCIAICRPHSFLSGEFYTRETRLCLSVITSPVNITLCTGIIKLLYIISINCIGCVGVARLYIRSNKRESNKAKPHCVFLHVGVSQR